MRRRWVLGVFVVGVEVGAGLACGSETAGGIPLGGDAAAGDGGRIDGTSDATNACAADTQSDLNNCGSCGLVCATTAPSTAECHRGRCLVTLASVPGTVTALAIDATTAYFAKGMDPVSIQAVPIGGGPATTLVSGEGAAKLVVTSTHLYWRNEIGLRRSLLDGSNPTTIVPGANTDFVVRPDGVLYGSGLAIFRAPLEGVDAGGPAVLVSSSSGTVVNITASDQGVFWTTGTIVHQAAADAMAPIQLAWSQIAAADIAVGPTHVYWASRHNQPPSFNRVPIGGGEWQTLLTDTYYPFAIDEGYAYAPNDSELQKLALGGGSPRGISSVSGVNVNVDATSVYFKRGGTGAGYVMRLTPK
jgi:hypothetical protein